MGYRKRSAVEWFAELERIARERHNLSDDWVWMQAEWIGDRGKDGLRLTLGPAGQSGTRFPVMFTNAECDEAIWEDESC